MTSVVAEGTPKADFDQTPLPYGDAPCMRSIVISIGTGRNRPILVVAKHTFVTTDGTKDGLDIGQGGKTLRFDDDEAYELFKALKVFYS